VRTLQVRERSLYLTRLLIMIASEESVGWNDIAGFRSCNDSIRSKSSGSAGDGIIETKFSL